MNESSAEQNIEKNIEENIESAASEGTRLGSNWKARVLELTREVAAREGCEVYDMEFVGSGGSRVLRIYLDKSRSAEGESGAGKMEGVSLDDCSNVSRGLNLILDVEDIVPGGAYSLEVSSPGLERPLRTPEHFIKACGARVQLKVFEPFVEFQTGLEAEKLKKLGKAKQLEGTLVACEDRGEALLLRFEGENGGEIISLQVPFAKISKASTVFVFGSSLNSSMNSALAPNKKKEKSGKSKKAKKG